MFWSATESLGCSKTVSRLTGVNQPSKPLLSGRSAVLKVRAGSRQPIYGLTISSGPSFNVTATKEVILSAGSYETPHLLLSSGIGDAAYLKSIGIPAQVHLPSVGKNLSDHVVVAYTWNLGINNVIDPYVVLCKYRIPS